MQACHRGHWEVVLVLLVFRADVLLSDLLSSAPDPGSIPSRSKGFQSRSDLLSSAPDPGSIPSRSKGFQSRYLQGESSPSCSYAKDSWAVEVESVENSLSRRHELQSDRNLDDKSAPKSSSSELNANRILDDLDSVSFLETVLNGAKITNQNPDSKSPMENLVLESSKSNLDDIIRMQQWLGFVPKAQIVIPLSLLSLMYLTGQPRDRVPAADIFGLYLPDDCKGRWYSRSDGGRSRRKQKTKEDAQRDH
ncbi:uncharacterized protein A4U43_C03F24740 [Asparagus officinalis]|uniref:Uncharacterized protein n=1 Tax=Asparagus officinalis TaxID=4686 RepID=A0A5P1FFJ8_ASPOF|nr:uncharacterized protein A4U43_C03F24740 [Asparagus officinalis]